MAGDTVRVIAHFKILPGNEKRFIEQARATLVEPSRREAGCISYDLWQDRGDPTRFALVEEWESDEILDAHLALPSLQQAVGALMPLGDGSIAVQRLRSVTTP